MHWFFKLLIDPLLEALDPRTIVEIGVEVGAVTGPLLAWAQANGATLHAIDPDPALNVGRLQARYGEQLRFHRRKSLEVLGEIPRVDLALIDGDHNWYTVINELRTLERRAGEDGREPPVMLLHDVGWPYGRRDLYYDARAIPEAERQPYARGGVKPGRMELGPGLNDHLENAILEGTAANGVLSAAEDFLATSERRWRMWQIPGLSGMAIVASEPALAAHPAAHELLESTESAAFLHRQCEAIEEARIDAELKRANIQRRLAQTQLKQVLRSEDPGEKVALLRRVRELMERVEELEEEGEGRAALEEQVRVLEGAVARLGDEAMAAGPRDGAIRPPGGGADWERVAAGHAAATEQAAAAKEAAAAERERAEGAPTPEVVFVKPEARAERESRQTLLAEYVPLVEGALPRAERESWQTLLAEYVPLVEGALPCADERDPLSLPCPLDVRGMLREAGAEQAPGEPSVDVVVCVHDALRELRECLTSLLAKTDRPFHLIVVNDGSGEATSEFLRAFADRHPVVELIERGRPPHGYTLAANCGIAASAGEYVVLLNSDTVLTPGWLGRLVACGEEQAQVGIVGPLSNAASHQSVPEVKDEAGAWARNPLPTWMTAEGVAAIVAAGAGGAAPSLPFLNGFCYAIKRRVIEEIGLLDEERFAEGYCEENDYSVRARDAGFALAVVEDAYVGHVKSRSYGAGGRAELAGAHYEAFVEKHGRERVAAEVAELEAGEALAPARAAVARALIGPSQAMAALGERALSVAFVLPGLAHGGSGGSHSLYQETKALRELGVPARIMLPRWDGERAAAVYEDYEEIFETFADAEDLAERTADADVISATHHKSVALLGAIRERRSDFLAGYYVQDYEPLFSAAYAAQEAVASYTALPEMVLFAKSRWLCNVVAERHGLAVAKVEASIDGEVFHARGRGESEEARASGSPPLPGAAPARGSGPLRVAAMIRPRTARRQPLGTIAVLEELLARHAGEVEVSTFGCYADELRELLGASGHGARAEAIVERHRGLLGRAEVAALLRESDVFLDCSIYQAFGRTALEAMACGATAVVPSVGGVWEFVEQEGNALAVDTFGAAGAVAALERLVCDRALLERLKAGALETAGGYSATRAALSEYVLFERCYGERFGGLAGEGEAAPVGDAVLARR